MFSNSTFQKVCRSILLKILRDEQNNSAIFHFVFFLVISLLMMNGGNVIA